MALAPKAGGLSLSLGFKGQGAGKRGWVHIYFGPELYQSWLCFYRMCFFRESVTFCLQKFSSPWVSERDLIVALAGVTLF